MAETPATTQLPKTIVIVGGVAGGMSAATRLRRLDADANIIVLERSGHVSFANCGLPYFVAGSSRRRRTSRSRLRSRPSTGSGSMSGSHDEVVAIDRAGHTVTTRRRSQARKLTSPTTSSCSAWALPLCARPSPDTTGSARCGPSRMQHASPPTSASHRRRPS